MLHCTKGHMRMLDVYPISTGDAPTDLLYDESAVCGVGDASAAQRQLIQDPLQVCQHRQLVQQNLIHVAAQSQQRLAVVAALLEHLGSAAWVHQKVA